MSEGTVVAQSGPDGRFLLEDVGSGHWLGARKAGFAPSVNPMIIASIGATLDLEVRLTGIGGGVGGVVRDPGGNPVEGARVLVGLTRPKHKSLPDGTSGYRMPAQEAVTDADGRFLIDGLTPETLPIMVRAPGFGFYSDTVDVFESEVHEIEVRLQPGVRAYGLVTDAAGAPVPNARVDNGTHGFQGFRVRADATGQFQMEDLPAGELALYAQDASGDGVKVEEKFTVAPGESVEWNPVLVGGEDLRILIVDENGVGREGMYVELRGEPTDGQRAHFGFEGSDTDGRIVFPGCPDQPYNVEVRANGGGIFAAVRRSGVRTSDGELVIEVSTATDASIYIRGRLLLPDGSPAGAATISPFPSSGGGAPIETPDPDTGEFELGPYPPDEWSLWGEYSGFPNVQAGPVVVDADGIWEVGDLQFQKGGTLRVILDRSKIGPDANANFAVVSGDRVNYNSLSWDGDVAISGPLTPGDYQLVWDGDIVAAGVAPFRVVTETEALMNVRPESGSTHSIKVLLAEEDPKLNNVSFVVLADDGAVTYRGRLWRWKEGYFQRDICLEDGSWTVRVTTTDGRTVSGSLSASSGGERQKLELTIPAAAR